MAIERCATGIEELDQILRGGIPCGSTVLVAGGAGMGKTTIGMEFLARGAARGEDGVYFTATESVAHAQRHLRDYPFVDAAKLRERVRLTDLPGLLAAAELPEEEGTIDDGLALADAVGELVRTTRAKRLVIDSLTAVCLRLDDPGRIRDFVMRLGSVLQGSDCTSLLVSETPPRDLRYSMFDVEELVADGILFLSELERNNDLVRTLQVIKMRGTEHSRTKFMLDISEFGVSLAPLLKKFSDKT